MTKKIITTYHLHAIGVATIFTGTLNEAIEEAKKLDEEYQRFGGVTISTEGGDVLATVEDGEIEIN